MTDLTDQTDHIIQTDQTTNTDQTNPINLPATNRPSQGSRAAP